MKKEIRYKTKINSMRLGLRKKDLRERDNEKGVTVKCENKTEKYDKKEEVNAL
jgi:hypothetical protein